jgi:hypothetical protein
MWHSTMRAREREIFCRQMKFPDDDLCYPIPREVADIYNAPSDGGSQWMYSGFEHWTCSITCLTEPWRVPVIEQVSQNAPHFAGFIRNLFNN